jgi:hypothetical protein
MLRDGCLFDLFLSGPQGLDRVIVQTGLAERVNRSLPPTESADAAVLLGSSNPPLEQVARSLKANAVLYWEIQRWDSARSRSTARQILERLRVSGFSLSGLYWIRPRSGPPKVFVPLDVPGALAWYLDTFSGALGTLAARFPRESRILATSTFPRIGVVAVRGQRDQETARRLPVLAPERLPEHLRHAQLRPVVYFREHGRRTVVFPFTPTGAVPAAVLKFSPVRERGSRTTQEQETLREIRTRLDPIMAASIPEPLGQFEWSGLTVGIESYLAGRSFDRAAPLLGVPLAKNVTDLERVTEWLCRFHRQVSFGRPIWGGSEWALDEWIEKPLRVLETAFPLDRHVEHLFGGMRQRARELSGIPLPFVLSNWSLSLGNVIRRGEGIGVYDWETVSLGLPLADLVYFSIDWGRHLRPDLAASWRNTFAELLTGPPKEPVGNAIAASIALYMSELEIDRRFQPLLAVLTWVGRAERRLRKNTSPSRALDPRLTGLAEAAGDYFQI